MTTATLKGLTSAQKRVGKVHYCIFLYRKERKMLSFSLRYLVSGQSNGSPHRVTKEWESGGHIYAFVLLGREMYQRIGVLYAISSADNQKSKRR
ncbi:hypothetical protein LINPERHAP2_LOCUS33835 [Linum perenne]